MLLLQRCCRVAVVVFDDADQTVRNAVLKRLAKLVSLRLMRLIRRLITYAVGGQVPVVFGECLAVLTLLSR